MTTCHFIVNYASCGITPHQRHCKTGFIEKAISFLSRSFQQTVCYDFENGKVDRSTIANILKSLVTKHLVHQNRYDIQIHNQFVTKLEIFQVLGDITPVAVFVWATLFIYAGSRISELTATNFTSGEGSRSY